MLELAPLRRNKFQATATKYRVLVPISGSFQKFQWVPRPFYVRVPPLSVMHFTLPVLLFSQVYTWVSGEHLGKEMACWGGGRCGNLWYTSTCTSFRGNRSNTIYCTYCNKHQTLANIKYWKKTFNLLAINEDSLWYGPYTEVCKTIHKQLGFNNVWKIYWKNSEF